jgi:cell division protein FtsQ
MLMAARSTKRQQKKQPAVAWLKRWIAPLGMALGLIALLGAGAFGYHFLSQPGRLPLRVIEVSGELNRLNHDEIQHTVVDAIDGGFFSCDMQKLRLAVVAMPWVADVSIRRTWPDRLSMVVTEQVPLARWGDDALVSVNASVFRPSTVEDFPGLVKLSGPEGSQQRVVAFFQAVVTAAQARELLVREVELDERRHWWLRFDGGLTVSLGRESIDYRLAQFFRVYPSLSAQAARQPERVDMRYEHGFAVRWREPVNQETVAEQVKSQGKV